MADLANLDLNNPSEMWKVISDMVNEEMGKIVKKNARSIAEQAVTDWGQMPYGSGATNQMIGDVYESGQKATANTLTDYASRLIEPQYQYQQSQNQMEWQSDESEKNRQFTSEQSQLDRDWQEMLKSMELESQTQNQPSFFQQLLSGLMTGVGTAAGGAAGGGLSSLWKTIFGKKPIAT